MKWHRTGHCDAPNNARFVLFCYAMSAAKRYGEKRTLGRREGLYTLYFRAKRRILYPIFQTGNAKNDTLSGGTHTWEYIWEYSPWRTQVDWNNIITSVSETWNCASCELSWRFRSGQPTSASFSEAKTRNISKQVTNFFRWYKGFPS